MKRMNNQRIIRGSTITSPSIVIPLTYNQIMNMTALSYSDAKKLYSQYRAIANKRLARLEKSELRDISAAARWSKFQKVSELNERELRFKLIEVQKFLNLETSSVSGTRRFAEDTLENMRKKGLKAESLEDVNDYILFKQKLLARAKDDIKYEDIVEIWNAAREYKASDKKDLSLYQKLYKQLRKVFYGSDIKEVIRRL